MDKMRLGRTNLMVSRCGFGALPIQRLDQATAVSLLRQAYEQGIDFFDTARAYTDSEEKIGLALAPVRQDVVIATKTQAKNSQTLRAHLETSLTKLQTDRIDLYQLHNPEKLPDPADPDGIYAAMLAARQAGLIRFIGVTSHRLEVALAAARSGLYDTVQFPMCALSSPEDLELIEVCRQHDVGLIAMKALSGGLLTNIPSAFAFLRQYPNLLPIWGMQRETELVEFVRLEKNPPALDDTMKAIIAQDRIELAGSFCRGCGYCLPCPVGIPIPLAARITLLMSRSPAARFLEPEWQAKMELIEDCQHCGHCSSHCPYQLDTPTLLRQNLEDYRQIIKSGSGSGEREKHAD
jgi:uncharacterized protein